MARALRVNGLFYSLQGEGARTGRAAVFCRFSGCNLWSGREQDRLTSACAFCDTRFTGTDGPGGGVFPGAGDLAARIREVWDRHVPALPADPSERRRLGSPYVVLTGGEPTLQVKRALVLACHAQGLEVAVETNGTRPVAPGVDWICVSPKAGTEVVQRTGQELKLVHPQPGLPPNAVEHWAFDHFFLQPMDGPDLRENTQAAIAYCLGHPQWRLSVQVHKLVGIP